MKDHPSPQDERRKNPRSPVTPRYRRLRKEIQPPAPLDLSGLWIHVGTAVRGAKVRIASLVARLRPVARRYKAPGDS